jgi:phage tail sheath protein FI
MAVTYASPGVYVVEVKSGPQPIEATGTSLAAFIGITAEASIKKVDPNTGQILVDSSGKKVVVESRLKKPTLVTSWTQYTNIFGDFVSAGKAYLPDAVYGYFSNGGGPCYIISLRALDEMTATSSRAKAASVELPGTDGAPSLQIVAKETGVAGNAISVVIEAGEENTFSMKIGDETRTGLAMGTGGKTSVSTVRFRNVDITVVGSTPPKPDTYLLVGGADKATISDPGPLTVNDLMGDVNERLGLGGLEAEDQIRLVACPDVMTGYTGTAEDKKRVKAFQEAIINHCQHEQRRDRFAILDMPPKLNAQQALEWRTELGFDTSYAALYYPWIEVADYSDSPNTSRFVPPSGHLVGLYNRVDAERGIHKAPANETLYGAIGLQFSVSKGEQDVLNPVGVNCIRAFPERGIRVWGARTLSTTDGAWRYISVRRLFIMVETSLQNGMNWVVFEPNDRMLWAKIRRDVSSFLRTVWRSGALFGSTPEEAFYVKCDDELNPPEIRDLGQLIIEVGLAPVKPAEFVIFRVSQWAGANAEGDS